MKIDLKDFTKAKNFPVMLFNTKHDKITAAGKSNYNPMMDDRIIDLIKEWKQSSFENNESESVGNNSHSLL